MPAADHRSARTDSRALFIEMLEAHSDAAVRADCYRGPLLMICCAFVAVHLIDPPHLVLATKKYMSR
jgi:hypothetical protein